MLNKSETTNSSTVKIFNLEGTGDNVNCKNVKFQVPEKSRDTKQNEVQKYLFI